MKALFNFTEALKSALENNALVNQVTYGDLSEVDILKRNNFPLAHVGIQTGTISTATTTIDVNVLLMDIVDDVKTEETDFFFGEDNEHYVLNSMLAAATKLIQELLRGDLYAQGFQVYEDAQIEFFSERFEDKLAGVSITFNVTINNNLTLC